MKRPEKKPHSESFLDILGGKKNAIALLIAGIVMIGGGITAMEAIDARAREAQYIGTYPMANQHIEWNYAGKGGFWE